MPHFAWEHYWTWSFSVICFSVTLLRTFHVLLREAAQLFLKRVSQLKIQMRFYAYYFSFAYGWKIYMCFLGERKPNISSRRITISVQSIIFLIQVTAAWLIVVILCSKFAVADNEVKELLETSGESLDFKTSFWLFLHGLRFFFWCSLELSKSRLML